MARAEVMWYTCAGPRIFPGAMSKTLFKVAPHMAMEVLAFNGYRWGKSKHFL